MSFEKGMALLGEGVQHVEFAMRIYEWQVRRGKKAIFEHPTTSKAWEEESVQRVLQLPAFEEINANMDFELEKMTNQRRNQLTSWSTEKEWRGPFREDVKGITPMFLW